MDNLVTWLHNSEDSVIKIAADAHLKLFYIHAFVDACPEFSAGEYRGSNGRTSRLLMNLLLLQEHYPLVYIKIEDRTSYIKAIQKAVDYIVSNFSSQEYILNSNNLDIKELHDYYEIIFESIEYSLDEYITAAKESGL
jgi:Fic family protein